MVNSICTRVVVIKQPCLLRHILIERLESENDLEVVGIATDIVEASRLIRDCDTHVVTLDLVLEKNLGLTAIQELKENYPETGIVVCTCNAWLNDVHVGQAVKAGADALVSSTDSLDGLVEAIRHVRQNRWYISDSIELIKVFGISEDMRQGLSPREAEVFYLLGCSCRSWEIAQMLNVSLSTVNNLRARIRNKLDLTHLELTLAANQFVRSGKLYDTTVSNIQLITTLLLNKGFEEKGN